MKRRPLFVCALVGSSLLGACAAHSAPAKTDPFAADKPTGPVKPAPYEPKSGVYLGAALDTSQIQGDAVAALGAQMTDFNRTSGKKQALYMHFLQFPNQRGEFGTWDKDANGWIPAAKFAQACDDVGATPFSLSNRSRPRCCSTGKQARKRMRRPKPSRRRQARGKNHSLSVSRMK